MITTETWTFTFECEIQTWFDDTEGLRNPWVAEAVNKNDRNAMCTIMGYGATREEAISELEKKLAHRGYRIGNRSRPSPTSETE